MANTKYLNQVKLPTTFTPSNTAIIASDDGQVVAQKTQGQINAIAPSVGSETVFNGIENPALFAVSYDASTRIFSVTYSAGAAVTVGGVRYSFAASTVTTTAHATTAQQYYLYYAIGGTLTVSATFWNLLITAPLASVYYNPSNNGGAAAGFLQYEMHTGNTGMSNATHKYLHTTIGTQLLTGCSCAGYTLNTAGDANVSWQCSAGTIADEDIVYSTALQAKGGANTYRIMYLSGTIFTPVWNWIDVAESGIYSDGTDIYYNYFAGANWTLTPIIANSTWVNYYVIAITSYSAPQILVVMGQQKYTSLNAANAVLFSYDCSSFQNFSSEYVVLYRITYKRASADGPPGNAEISTFTKILQNILATSALNVPVIATNVSVNTSTFSKLFTSFNTDVQSCLNTIDSNIPWSLARGGTAANLTANNGGIFYSTSSAGAILAGTATARQILMSGASTTPAWSTATYPASIAANQLLYTSATNTIGPLTTAASGVLVTSAGSVPSISTTLPAVAAGACTCTDPTTSSSASINTALANVNANISRLSLVSASSPVTQTSVTINGLASGVTYYLVISIIQNTSAGYPKLNFNSDTGSNYVNASFYFYSGGHNNYGTTTTYVQLTNAADTLAATSPYLGNYTFGTSASGSNAVTLHGQRTYTADSGTTFEGGIASCQYNGVASLSSMTFSTSAGTFTGEIKLYKYL